MEIIKDKKTALLFGIDTIIGEILLELLLTHNAYQSVVVFTFKPLKVESEKLVEFIIDFDRPEAFAEGITGDDLYFCTTSFLQKTTYQAADNTSALKYLLPVAKIAANNQVNQLLVLSNNAANKTALLEVNKLRGEIEEMVSDLPFWAIHLFKPLILSGPSTGNQWGTGVANWLRKRLDTLTGGLVSKYRPIESDVVAKAMISAAQRFESGIHIYNPEYLQHLADEYEKEL